jgi:phage-related baseplate assembly protein
LSEIDLGLLPPPQAVEEIDAEEIVELMKQDFIANNPDMAEAVQYESDPVMMQFRTATARETGQRARINDGIRACMLAEAEGSDLDNLVALNGTVRVELRPADDSVYPPVEAVMEDDDRLARRYLEGWNELGAGAEGHYRSLALEAHPDVIDAYDHSPDPCIVDVYVLAETGVPGQGILDAVTDNVTDKTKRPQGDRVTARAAEVFDYEVHAKLTIPNALGRAEALAAAQKNVEELVKWSRAYGKTPMGRQVSRNLIIGTLTVEGVTDLELIKPVSSLPVAGTQAARCTSILVELADG